MSIQNSKMAASETNYMAGQELRAQAEALGAELQDGFTELVSRLPRRILGPQALVDTLEGINVVTGSRLLKALAQNNSIATLQLLPGPKPLQQVVDAAKALGLSEEATAAAEAATNKFNEFIRVQSGDRSSLKAMLSAWLPEERREFETQRRQTIFKARHELDGVSSELELDSIFLHPSLEDGCLDIVNAKCLFGIDRIRPDTTVNLGTRRLTLQDSGELDAKDASLQRLPMNLDGELAHDGLHSVCLNEFCNSPPAPLKVDRFGQSMHYSLGPTGFGPASKVDLVVAEVNKGELRGRIPSRDKPPHFWVTPEMCSRKLVFDLILHEDVFPSSSPTLYFYDTTGRGPAAVGDPERTLDQRQFTHSVEELGSDLRRMRLMEFPAYGTLKANIFEKMKWDGSKFRGYRVSITYPLTGVQVSLAFHPPSPGDSQGRGSRS
ncbi:MAG: hypothetical protein ACI89E_000161 [Planctomycetota bacterium]|jgi:hypothetical protein